MTVATATEEKTCQMLCKGCLTFGYQSVYTHAASLDSLKQVLGTFDGMSKRPPTLGFQMAGQE